MKKNVSLKWLAALAAVLLAFVLAPAVFATDTDAVRLSVNLYGNDANAADTVVWQEVNGKMYLFLPGDTDPADAKVYFNAEDEVRLDGALLHSGDSAVALLDGQNHTVTVAGETVPLTVLRSANIPAVFIRTKKLSIEDLNASKENKDKAAIRVYESGELTVDEALKQIKGRGNSTWMNPKKPYNIKFENKIDLLGMGKSKKFSLLASYHELTLLRNPAAFTLADMIGMHYTSHFRHVDLFVNNAYLGSYILCESVEVGTNRVEINDLDGANEEANPDLDLEELPNKGTGKNGAVQKGTVYGSKKWIDIPNDPADITGGYLMELDYSYRYDAELSGFVTSTGQPITFKCPEFATEREIRYISAHVDAAFRALKSPTGYNDEGKHYSEYFDMDTLVAAYILEEYSKDYDAGFSSFYLYKRQGDDKLYCSPAWDFDSGFGLPNSSRRGVLVSDETLWFANQLHYNGTANMLNYAYRQADFRAAVSARYAELYHDGFDVALADELSALAVEIRPSAVMDGVFWNAFRTRDPDACTAAHAANSEQMISWLGKRAAQLSKGFGEDAAWVTYDMNGAKYEEIVTSVPIVSIGQQVTLSTLYDCGVITPPVDRQYLQGWNTEADGSGTMFQPGQTVTLDSPALILYAIWGDKPVTERDLQTTPAAVRTLSAKATGDGSITLSWSPAERAEQYNVFRWNAAKQEYLYVGCTRGNDCDFEVSGLVGGTDYYFRVQTVARKGGLTRVGAFSGTVACKAVGTPSAVRGLRALATAENTISLSWNAVYGATQYNVYRYRADRDRYVYIGTSYETGYSVNGLTGGTEYYFKVVAAAKGSGLTFTGPLSQEAHAMAVATPGVVTGLTASATGDGEITLNWKKAAGVTRWDVYRWHGTLNRYVYLGAARDNSYHATELTGGTEYYFKVCPVSEGDGLAYEGPLSDAVRAVAHTRPGVVSGLSAAASGDGEVTVSWKAVSGATQYNVYRYRSDRGSYVYVGTTRGRSLTVSGLTGGTRYRFKVSAVYKAEGLTLVGSLSPSVSVVAACRPDAPASLKAAPTGDGTVTLRWSRSSGASGYRVYRWRADQKAYVQIGETDALTCKVEDLVGGTTYYFKVAAFGASGSDVFVGPLTEAVSVKAVGTPAAPTGLKGEPTGDGQITLTWNASYGATQYDVYRYYSEQKQYVYVDTAFTTNCVCKDLTAGTTYYFKVRAVTNAQALSLTGPLSAAVTVKAAGAPGAPSSLKVTPTDDGQVTLRWTPVHGATGYIVYRFRSGENAYVRIGESDTETFVVNGLVCGTEYYFKTAAVCRTGELTFVGPRSQAASVKAVGTPAKPVGLKGTPTGEGQITLTWNASYGATQYNVYRYRADLKQYIYVGTTFTASYLCRDLTAGTNYHFMVKPVTKAAGFTFVGPRSAAIDVLALGTPAAPSGLKANAAGNGQITLTWDAVYGATQYNVFRYRADQKQFVYIGTSYAPTYYCKGLTEGVTYYFKVMAAVKGEGLTFTGPYSQIVSTEA